ncbi:MAG: hypothetical protein ABIS50_02075 [Luteolibacter sp.]|uniref:hypothetical protein n=1 Tax=Luteolibacter sp. TaxID=1962973 RepID=UPI003266E43A
MKNLAFCALVGASGSAIAAPMLMPNGDFTAGGTSWAQVHGGISYSYPATGGNPGGYGIMDATNGQWAIWVANGDAPIPLSSLGLVAGKTYTFKQDMITLISGVGHRGGVKIESWNGAHLSNSGDMYATSTSGSWETYSFTYTIDPAATAIKVVPLWGENSSIGYDNILVDNTQIVPPPVVPVIPNGTFSAAGTAWAFFQGGGQTVSYPGTGGNPDGCAVIDSVGKGAYAVMVANNNAPMSLASLGLTAGKTYTFQQDMKILAGTHIGGLKVEFVPTGTGDLYPTIIGDGTSWATYSFQITIPPTCTQLMVVPLWGPDSMVAYDNFKILPPPPPGAPSATINTGTLVGWTPTSEANSYQVQESTDGFNWSDVGTASTGTSVTSKFALGKAPFYQVIEKTADQLGNGVPNPSFETTAVPSNFNPGAENWNIVVAPNVGASMTVGSSYGADVPHEGSQMLVIESSTAAEGPVSPPNTDVRSDFFSVTGGVTYTFSFYALNPIKVGGANPQYSFEFFNNSNVFIGNSYTSFASVGSTWTKVEKTFTAPAGTAKMRIGWIQAMGAGNGWQWVSLIDEVSLPTPSVPGDEFVLEATAAPAVEVTWDTLDGSVYQVKSSTNLSSWSDLGTSVIGNGSPYSIVDPISVTKKFYKVLQTTP